MDRLGSCVTFVDTRDLRCAPFEGKRRQVLETRAYADRVVVAHVLLALTAERALRGEGDAPRELRLEGMEERFGMRIVAGTAHARALEEPELGHARFSNTPAGRYSGHLSA